MTGDQSRTLSVGDRVCWHTDKNDQGTITEKNWAGVTIKWNNRSKHDSSQRHGSGRAGADEFRVGRGGTNFYGTTLTQSARNQLSRLQRHPASRPSCKQSSPEAKSTLHLFSKIKCCVDRLSRHLQSGQLNLKDDPRIA